MQIVEISMLERSGRTLTAISLLKGFRNTGVNAVLMATDTHRQELIERFDIPRAWLTGLNHQSLITNYTIIIDDYEHVEAIWNRDFSSEGLLRPLIGGTHVCNPNATAFIFCEH
ncbi:hypothetical protein [Yersinia hibernica]|uniref:Uncharacterized protein n=1 Tax=Yersinia enterocolitica LC20 TaxID=1443113 RepID=A0A7U5PGJ9_YEREN|nr:hypothetical protein [Yersinia hibernica]ATX62697.1 hypothetical protein LC20_06490 [Yersinia hibernica]ATX62787.1 hypothetical protein LC20_07230 [Yersinia hibernica]